MEAVPRPAAPAVRTLVQPAELRAAVALYRRVLGLGPTDPAVSPRLLAALRHNGGSVIGAFDGTRLVGFAYGFVGRDAGTGEIYHYSQAAVVDPDVQGRGVGRALKFGQRAFVLRTGLTRMRWSFDPVRASNGHFNLDVLGARARWFVRNLYGVDDMGRDLGQPSDRLIVEWDLLGPPTPPMPPASQPVGALVPGWGEVVPTGADLLIGVPRDWPPAATEPSRAQRIRTSVSAAFEDAMARGFVAVSCQISGAAPDSAWYHLRPGDTEPRCDT
ncbi:GNAT family N-acetyltransferase [Actinopolymorpha alba]|uniref:GNAT family N-acetyltransferase n=1 Tax=Actinopolymorpha alba TaxID=533267 RepID=UPI00035FAA10|nr:GNAT family N-acetyltransferase [Actinopolymorpha alba]